MPSHHKQQEVSFLIIEILSTSSQHLKTALIVFWKNLFASLDFFCDTRLFAIKLYKKNANNSATQAQPVWKLYSRFNLK